MKTLLFTILFLGSIFSFSQTVSTMRMADFRLGMTVDEVSSLLNKKILISSVEDDFYHKDLIISNHGITYEIVFHKVYEEELKEYVYKVYSVKTTNPQVKTLSNITVGSSLEDLWSVYKNYTFNLYKKWDDKTEQFSKDVRIFELLDTDASTALIFTLKNNKIISITISYNYEECC